MLRVPILKWLYGGAYGNTVSLIPVVALLPIAAAFSAVLGSALRALERPQQVFWAYITSAAVTVTVGIWGMSTWGLAGAAIGLFLSSAITPIVCGVFLSLGSRSA